VAGAAGVVEAPAAPGVEPNIDGAAVVVGVAAGVVAPNKLPAGFSPPNSPPPVAGAVVLVPVLLPAGAARLPKRPVPAAGVLVLGVAAPKRLVGGAVVEGVVAGVPPSLNPV
jgi:hypothetical protein